MRITRKESKIMDWMQFATFMITNIVFTLTLWLWNRSESSNDRRELRSVIDAIQTEMKDFHGKLCELQERSRK